MLGEERYICVKGLFEQVRVFVEKSEMSTFDIFPNFGAGDGVEALGQVCHQRRGQREGQRRSSHAAVDTDEVLSISRFAWPASFVGQSSWDHRVRIGN